jgi:hypothetical protein
MMFPFLLDITQLVLGVVGEKYANAPDQTAENKLLSRVGRGQATSAATFSSKYLLTCTHEAEWSPSQTHYFSENLVAPEIELVPLDL